MKNQKLNLADFQANQLSKKEYTRVFGGGDTTVIPVPVPVPDPIGDPIPNPGNGNG